MNKTVILKHRNMTAYHGEYLSLEAAEKRQATLEFNNTISEDLRERCWKLHCDKAIKQLEESLND